MKDYQQFQKDLQDKANQMKVRVPKAHYVPSREAFYPAGSIAQMMKAIRQAFNNNPDQEFKQSFSCWYPVKAKDIIKYEIHPMIHERINIRALIK